MSRWWVMPLAVIALGLLLWQANRPAKEQSSDVDEIEVNEPDLFGQDVTYDHLRADGSIQYRVGADTIRQFNAENLTRMTQPTLKLYNPEQPPWDIRANHGYVRQRETAPGKSEQVVYLREDVVMIQSSEDRGDLVMRAEAFYIYPDRQYAQTDQDVMIDSEVGRTRAGGLKADLATGLLILSSSQTQRVHTIVLPEQFKSP